MNKQEILNKLFMKSQDEKSNLIIKLLSCKDENIHIEYDSFLNFNKNKIRNKRLL